ncbi:MAG TPA: 2-phospho-L-lactate transferase [Nitrososphaera sp.]|nr:2-phospho-L-lactate transferase [Nitrososphaera sp.]
MIAIIAGGTGSVKLVRGLALLEKEGKSMQEVGGMSVIANVGDNMWLYGLYVCPDVDTMVYGLAGMLDEERGWGIRGDTFTFLDQMKRSGVDTWFGLGDRDLATHILRTHMMMMTTEKAAGRKEEKRKKKSLTQVTAYFAEKFGTGTAKVLPATDNDVETMITTCDAGEMHLQEFWVKNAGRPEVQGIRYRGIGKARATRQALDAIKNADRIIIAPGNPVSSIGPSLALVDLKAALAKRRSDVIAVSPVIGNAALSGPAVKYMNAVGVSSSAAGVAEFYQQVAGTLVIDNRDQDTAGKITAKFGIDVYETNITMQGRQDEVRLGRYLLQLQQSRKS